MSNEQISVIIDFIPMITYLSLITLLLIITQKVFIWIHPIFGVTGLILQILNHSWTNILISTPICALIFVFMVFIVGNTVSGVTLFSSITTLLITPLSEWWCIALGLGFAAVIALVRTWKHLGKNRVIWLAMDTANAVGVSPNGVIKRPEPNLIPERSQLTDVHDLTINTNKKIRMYMSPYLLTGGIIGLCIQLFTI